MTTPTTPEQPEPSATPRTDEARATFNEQCDSPVAAEEMAKLERELASTRAASAPIRRLTVDYITLGQLGWTDGNEWFPELSDIVPPTKGSVLEIHHKPARAALSRATTQAGGAK